MIEKNTTDAPSWVLKPKNAFLLALHVLFLVVSVLMHPPIETVADRALP